MENNNLSKQEQLVALLNLRDAFNQIETRNVFSGTVTAIRNTLQVVIASMQSELGVAAPSVEQPQAAQPENPLSNTTSDNGVEG